MGKVDGSDASASPTTYATGQLDQETPVPGDTFCEVPLSNVHSCPLSKLNDVQVHVGGMLKDFFGSAAEGFFDAHEEDSDNAKAVNFYFDGAGKFWFSILVNGWPREEWEEVATDLDFDNEEMLQYLTRGVERRTLKQQSVS